MSVQVCPRCGHAVEYHGPNGCDVEVRDYGDMDCGCRDFLHPGQSVPPDHTEAALETLLSEGRVHSALLLKGEFTDTEREMIRRAYELGFQHGRAALTSPEART